MADGVQQMLLLMIELLTCQIDRFVVEMERQNAAIQSCIQRIYTSLSRESGCFHRHTAQAQRRRLKLRRRNALRMLCSQLALPTVSTRQVWTRERSGYFWETTVDKFTEADWIKKFRMSPQTFNKLCCELQPFLERCDTQLRVAVPVRKRVAIAVWWLATGDLLRCIAHQFGVSQAFVCLALHEVCSTIELKLKDKYIVFPTGDALRDTIRGFRQLPRGGFPQCAGAIDGYHIPVISPHIDSHTDYINRKGWHSVILQAVVDHCSRFTYINVGMPGSMPHARVLRNSKLFLDAESGALLPEDMTEVMHGVPVPLAILGDPAYPLLPWLMKAYPENGHLTPEEKFFNYRFSNAWMKVEGAYGMLKGRWQCLLKRIDVHISKVPNIVVACCVLHNLCEMNNEAYEGAPPDAQPMDCIAAVSEGRPRAARDAIKRLLLEERAAALTEEDVSS